MKRKYPKLSRRSKITNEEIVRIIMTDGEPLMLHGMHCYKLYGQYYYIMANKPYQVREDGTFVEWPHA